MTEDQQELRVSATRVETPLTVTHYPDGRPSAKDRAKHSVFVRDGENFAILRERPLDGVCYVGTPPSGGRKPCRYALGVFDPSTAHLKLLPVRGNAVVRMEPRIDGLLYAPSGKKSVESSEAPEKTQRDATNTVLRAFGGAASKKRLRQSETAQSGETSQTKSAVLGSLVLSINDKAIDEGLTRDKALEIRNIPPFHEDATTLEEAFVFDDLCPEVYQETLRVETYRDAAVSQSARLELLAQGESKLALQLLPGISEKRGLAKERMLQGLCFLGLLLKLNRLQGQLRRVTGKTLPDFAHKHDIDLTMLQFLISLFYVEKNVQRAVKYELPETKKQLMHCYILVTALMVNGSEMKFEMVDMLRLEMKSTWKGLTQRFQSFGAQILKRGGDHVGFGVQFLKNGKSMKDSLPKIGRNQTPKRTRFS